MRLLIIRHGDPDYENDCLTEKGKKEAALLAEYLKDENIHAVYSSPLGRAKETCRFVTQKKGLSYEEKDWLREFNYGVNLPSGYKANPWDFMPAFWSEKKELYTEEWLYSDIFKNTDTPTRYAFVCKSLDELLEKHGYKRDGKNYRVMRANRDTVALFCHFGIESVLLSHLFSVSPVVLLQHTCALTTSVTTLYTEERERGIAAFRMCGFGDLSHLALGKELPSFSARFCETFDCKEERH